MILDNPCIYRKKRILLREKKKKVKRKLRWGAYIQHSYLVKSKSSTFNNSVNKKTISDFCTLLNIYSYF